MERMMKKSLKDQLISYAARYTLLYVINEEPLPWVVLRNIFIMQQCSSTEMFLSERGWKILVSHNKDSGFPVYIALSKYGRKLIVNYSNYQKEMAKIR
ncbi:hypothetical protein D8V81_23210 [Salmonella enterica]|nr:hypothetical protein [Salmonella enterica]